jgi:hypothetical protein
LQLHCYDFGRGLKHINDEKQFALLMRYQNQNERAIDKCVNQLLKLQTGRRKEQSGFESQIRPGAAEIRKDAAETRKKEVHDARLRLINARTKAIEVDSDIRQTREALSAYDPDHLHIPFNELSDTHRRAIRQVSPEIQEKEIAA